MAVNSGLARDGSITIANVSFAIHQASGCTYTISPTSNNNVSSAGTSGTINVAAATACAWTAASNNSWIAITSGATGSGNGSAGYSVAANPTGLARDGSITIANTSFAIHQGSGCAYSISPSGNNNASSSGASGTINVTVGTGCTWTAASNNSWITITSGATGSGTGSAGYSVAANTGLARDGSITIANASFAIHQGSGCTYSISPGGISFPASGTSSGSFSVTAGSGCSWGPATAGASWVTITSGSGAGNGSVTFSVARNAGAPRNTTITVAGQSFTVVQEWGCSYQLSHTSQSFDRNGGTGAVFVSPSDPSCPPFAQSPVDWVQIMGAQSQNGGYVVYYWVAQNNTGSARGVGVNIAGQPFMVFQAP